MLNKVYISYFYQIRFFPPNFVPLSTAVWDPKWYHDWHDQHYTFIDKRGVINGLRFTPFTPGKDLEGLCRGPEEKIQCNGNPDNCIFLNKYRLQLNKFLIDKVTKSIEKGFEKVGKFVKTSEPLVPVFIVHEAPSKVCSERKVISNYFINNGINVEEFNKNAVIKCEDLFTAT